MKRQEIARFKFGNPEMSSAREPTFIEAIKECVGASEVLIALMGKRWVTSSDEDGIRRLDKSERSCTHRNRNRAQK